MTQPAKPLWGEGLFLCPQHFQRQDAYHESRLQETRQALHPYSWGVRSVGFDSNSLTSGILRPTDISVIFPDGELYDAPDKDELPAPIMLEELPEGTQQVTVHIALPLLKEHGGNCASDEANHSARYHQNNVATNDIFSDAAETDIAFLRKSVRLLTDDQPRDAFVTVPLVKLRRSSTGPFEIDQEFMAPSVSLFACHGLQSLLRSLLDALKSRSNALYKQHRKPNESIVEFRSGDTASFWLLHTINAAFATLSHFHRHAGLAPERLHQELLRIAGSLLTFSTAYQLDDLPEYDHLRPAAGFHLLFRIIHEQINMVMAANYVKIDLTEIKPSYHSGQVDLAEIGADAALYLAVKAAVPPAELIETVPSRFKLGSPEDVDNIVLSALPGITLSHQSQVPSAIPVRPGSTYFALESRGTLYERMMKAGAITVYVPSGMSELNLELLAITS